MCSNKWVPQVLKDVEKYCYENNLPEVANCIEEARAQFQKSQVPVEQATRNFPENVFEFRRRNDIQS